MDISIDFYQKLGLTLGIRLEHAAFMRRLEAIGAKVIGSQGKGMEEPIVQRWMPAASVYFEDPDGNKL